MVNTAFYFVGLKSQVNIPIATMMDVILMQIHEYDKIRVSTGTKNNLLQNNFLLPG